MKLNHKLAFGILAAVGITGAVNAQVIGYWNFEEKLPGNAVDNTTNAIIDLSGNSHSGTVSDPGAFYVAGNSNYAGSSALEFTLGPDHVTVPDPAGAFNFSSGQSITLEAMIKTTTIGEDGIGAICCKQGANPGEWWWRINATGTQQFYIDDGSGSRSASGTKKLNDGQWHHVAAVFDANAKQMRVFVDYVQDGNTTATTYSSGAAIGNAEDLWIAAFQAGNRQFTGDMDFVRITGSALAPADFIQPQTYITGISPTNGSGFLPVNTPAGFEIKSAVVGVLTNGVHVTASGTDISSQLQFSGNANDWQVSLPTLVANHLYNLQISVTDQQGHQVLATNIFNTFSDNLFSFEAEDYNFGGGQFIDNPQLSGADGPDNYLDRLGVQGVDFAKTNPPVATLYRIGDAIGTVVSTDVQRQEYIDAEVNDPGIADYMTKDFINGEWVNYTRTFPANSYHVYARIAKSGTAPMVMRLDEVTGDRTAPDQTAALIGYFVSAPTPNAQSYVSVPLTDAFGNEVSVPLSGVKTLRVTMVSGTKGMTMNYFICVPEGGVQVPYLAAISPAAAADNEPTNTSVHITIRNADTQINAGSVQLKLDGAAVSPTVISTTAGAQVDYVPASVTVGLHTVSLTFNDSASTVVTNSWQFRVASEPVRGLWNFNEKSAGSFVSITPGAILDASGNSRNGTANDSSMQYVSGSFNYGNTTALQFTPGFDHVMVPDHSGDFNFNGSFTWEAVIRSSSTATNLAILAKNGTGDGEGEYWWRMPGPSGGVQYVGMDDGNGGKFIGGTRALNDGNWHHVAVVYDTNAQQIRLYADYQLDGTLTNVLFANRIGRPSDLWIGSFNGGGSDFDGDIDAIRLSSGALTPAQFLQTTVALSPLVKSVRPATNALNVFPKPLIEMDLLNRDTQVQLSTLKMYIDGSDISAGATKTTNVTGASIYYTPTTALADGSHTVSVTFNDTASPANFVSNQWSFSVINHAPVIALYQFNEQAPGNFADTNTGAIIDSSGNNHNGTVVTAAPLPYVEGSTNYGDTSALEFAVASTTHIDVPDTTTFDFFRTQSITMEAVIRTTTIGQAGVGCILAKQGANPGEWYWRISANGLQRFSANDGSGLKTVNGTKALNDGNWHHVAAVYDGNARQMRVYVDYALDGTIATTFSSTNSPIGNALDLFIGAQQNNSSKYEGDIDVIRVTAVALDTSSFIPIGGIPATVPGVSLSNVTGGAGMLSFSFATDGKHSYVVQSTTALGSPWVDVETFIGDGSARTVMYQRDSAQKFYRVKVQ